MNMVIEKLKISEIDLKPTFDKINTNNKWSHGWVHFLQDAGQRHYKLLAYLSKQLKDGDIVIDLGTLTGVSSLALSYNQKIKVYSFNLPKQTFHTGVPGTEMFVYESDEHKRVEHDINNIEYIIGDCLEYGDLLLKSSLIFIDIDHSGVVEKKILDFLRNNSWEGIVVMDDIYWRTMLPLWDSILEPKWDVSFCGDSIDGTGLINFGEKYKITIK